MSAETRSIPVGHQTTISGSRSSSAVTTGLAASPTTTRARPIAGALRVTIRASGRQRGEGGSALGEAHGLQKDGHRRPVPTRRDAMATREASQSYTAAGSWRRRRRRLVAVAAVTLAVCVVGYGAVSYVVYDGLSHRVPCAYTGTPDAFATDVAHGLTKTYPIDVGPYLMPSPQDVTFASRDPGMGSARLAGWWIPADATAAAGAPAVLVVHGVQACRREPSLLLAAGMLHRHGYSVFMLDLRDHGDSGGDDGRFSGGTEEYLDVL